MSRRGYRGKDRGRRAEVGPGAEAEGFDYRVALPEDGAPGLDAPVEELQAWFDEALGPGVISEAALAELRERDCAMPDCTARAKGGSMFCGYHHLTAVGEAGARELRALNREVERLARITDREAQQVAVAKFRSRVEGGQFALLFSRGTREAMEQAAEDIVLNLELGALRVALARAMEEIEDPKALSLAISRLANAASRASRVNIEMRRARRMGL